VISKINCPYCNKTIELKKVPYLDKELYRMECKPCHIFVTAESYYDIRWLLDCLYRGQLEFEVRYVDQEIIQANIGGGHRTIPVRGE